MLENEIELSQSSHILIDNIEDKNNWIYLHGSLELQRSFNLGYQCEDKYVRERIDLEYPGFMRYAGTPPGDLFKKVDMPSPDAISQVLRWDNAYIGRGLPTILRGDDRMDIRKQIKANQQEVIVVPNYLGKYTIIKKVISNDEIFFTNKILPILINFLRKIGFDGKQ